MRGDINVAYIYKITNKINQKIYIGKTETSIEKRFKQHCQDAFRERNEKRPLYAAMRKYGIENFKIECIEETDNPEEREVYWIKYYHSFHNGYNATLGGDGKHYLDHDLILQLIKERKTYKEIMQIVKCSEDSIRNIAQKNGYTVQMGTAKRVTGVNIKTQQVIVHDSCAAAARWLVQNNYTYSNPRDISSRISQVCRGIRKTAYGFKWEWYD